MSGFYERTFDNSWYYGKFPSGWAQNLISVKVLSNLVSFWHMKNRVWVSSNCMIRICFFVLIENILNSSKAKLVIGTCNISEIKTVAGYSIFLKHTHQKWNLQFLFLLLLHLPSVTGFGRKTFCFLRWKESLSYQNFAE